MTRLLETSSRSGARVAVGCLATICLCVGSVAVAGATEEDDQPGVYIEEVPTENAGSFAAPSSVGLFVGAGSSSRAQSGDALHVADMAEFEATVDNPSEALHTAMEHYFGNTESAARLVLASSEDSAELVTAISSVTADVGPALWVAPGIGALSGADYQSVAVELSGAAQSSMGIALLDPPSEVVEPLAGSKSPDVSTLVGLAGILRSAVPDAERIVMYSAPLVVQGAEGDSQVPASSVMAAEFMRSDENAGQWIAPAGTSYPLTGYEPLYSIDNATNATLNTAGIDAIRTIPGYGTVVWGSRTLGEVQGQVGYVATVRTLDMVNLSLLNGAKSYSSSPNDKSTWAEVDRGATAFLEQLWNEGALVGSSAEEAYDVKVGVPESMTEADVSDGRMRVIAEVAVTFPGEFLSTEVSVEMTGG